MSSCEAIGRVTEVKCRVAVSAESVANDWLFNFSASYTGGGYKRLRAFAEVLERKGGASFIVHPRCAHLATEYPANRYFVVWQSRIERLLDDASYLESVVNAVGKTTLYYAYGVPIYHRCAEVNWFHLSNALPLALRDIPTTTFEWCKMQFLGKRIRRYLVNADVISAESGFALGLLDGGQLSKRVVSVNGGDDVLAAVRATNSIPASDFATAVGTYRYKALDDTLRIFASLRRYDESLRLRIIGEINDVARRVGRDPSVDLMGSISPQEVLACLGSSRYYISMSRIENSSNATLEGVCLAQKSILSDIAPHRELLRNWAFDKVRIPAVKVPVLKVERPPLAAVDLRTWESVVDDIEKHVRGFANA